MVTSDLLATLLELLGLKTSQKKKFQKMERLLRDKKAVNEDRIEGLKDKIARVERQVLTKKREYEAAKGDMKRIVGGEIERLFEESDRSRGQETILARNLGQIGLGLAKLAEIQASLDSGVEESVFDELALELQDIFGEMKEVDQEARELEATKYTAPQSRTVDLDARMAELEGHAHTATPQRHSESPEGLSQASLDRMKELDSEE